eukprot:sb/3478738/
MGSETPIPCPRGTYGDETGSTSEDACMLCPAGSYCPERSQEPILCPAGYYSTEAGADSLDICRTCPSGYYCPNEGIVVPIECPDGYSCPEGSTEPITN